MKAFCITLVDHYYSLKCGKRCIESAREVGKIEVEMFPGIGKDSAECVMAGRGLRWTYKANTTCPVTGLYMTDYHKANREAKIGCAMSHHSLWKRCVELDEPILILEHDVVFLRAFEEFEFHGICQINDPSGATPFGDRWSRSMVARGTTGVHPKQWVQRNRNIPDGLAGNSAYVIKPFAAQELMDKYRDLGVWPNDATMCKQLFPYLQEYFPFVTRVEQRMSTSSE